MKKCQRPECNNETKTKYCSRSCSAKVNNVKHPKRQPQGKCRTCSKVMISGPTYCSKKCRPARKRLICKKCDEPVVDRSMCREHYNEHMAKYMTERYHRRRNAFVEKRGGCCEKCGSTDQLEIDHIDPSKKSFSVGAALSGWAEKRIQEELSKCQVLCNDCHKEKTAAAYAGQQECIYGHPYGDKNLGINTRGNRYCKYCRYSDIAKKKGRKVKTFEEWLQTK